MKRGFTLIEVIISLALISMLVLAIGGLNLTSVRIRGITRSRDEAFNIARALCEMLRSEDFILSHNDNKGIYKYINSIEEIGSVSSLLQSFDGIYDEGDLPDGNPQKRFTVMLKISGAGELSSQDALIPQVNFIRVTVYEKDHEKHPVSFTLTR